MTPTDVSREALIKQAAHVWSEMNSAMFWAKAEKLGLTREETQEAIVIARTEANERHIWCRMYGNPEYGGWRTDKRDGRRKPAAVIPREFQQ